MKKLSIICAVLMMFAVSAVAQDAKVNVSLEPSTKIVGVGDTFDLELWFRSSPTGVVVHHLDDLGLHWDPACVSFNGPASTADGLCLQHGDVLCAGGHVQTHVLGHRARERVLHRW